MAREILPYIPDAKAFFKEKLKAKKPEIKIGAEIPFTKLFYNYIKSIESKELVTEFTALEVAVRLKINSLF